MKLTQKLKFQWDRGNKDKNWRKHQVAEAEAQEIFASKPRVVFLDKDHSNKHEIRYNILGMTKSKRLLSVVFTIRHNQVRIISARSQSRKERKKYEQIQKTKINS